MWCSERRRWLVTLAALALAVPAAGCFRPMLAAGGAADTLYGRIALPEAQDRFGYFLRQSLASRLGDPREPRYRLEVRTRLRQRDLAVTQDNAVTRISLTAIAEWTLYREGDSEPLLTARTLSQSGYNSTASMFATRSVRRDIERRLARDLGERISRALLARAATLEGNG